MPTALAAPSLAHAAGGSSLDPLEPASTGGLPLIDRALARLSTHERLLIIAAHPDDEDNTLLTHVSRARGGEAAYLSLTRGDGGQNLLGEELGVGLGLLRSRELQAARQVDGGRQFFTRAYDFGYTRSLDEALRRWPLETLVDDALRVVERFKPQVIVAIFPPDERAGHGQHQASAVVAREVFDAARDAEGGWKPASFFRAAFFLREEGDVPSISLPLGTLEPLSGRSIFQIAMESRSMHRCQDMGLLQPLGDADGRLLWVAGIGQSATELFQGIDTSLPAMADPLGDAELRRRVAVELDAVETAADAARTELSARRLAERPGPLLRALTDIARRLDAVLSMLDAESEGAGIVRELVAEKRIIAHEALAAAAGLAVDAFVDVELSEPAVLVPGQTFDVRVQSWHETAGGSDPALAPVLDSIQLLASDGGLWTPEEELEPETPRGFFATRIPNDRILRLRVPDDASPTLPYFLGGPRHGDLYDWSGVAEDVRGEPFGPPALRARFRFVVGDAAQGQAFELEREVVFRTRDQARGEVRRPLRLVPPVEVSLSDDSRVWSTSEQASNTTRLEVTVQSHLDAPVDGVVETRLEAVDASPGGQPTMPEIPIRIEPESRRVVTLDLPGSGTLAPGSYRVAVSLRRGASTYGRAVQVIDYEHIRPVPRPVDSALDLRVADIALPEVSRIGYVRGASDRVPEMLLELGLPVEIFTAEQLNDAEPADLAKLDALVIGSRAYETDPALAQANVKVLGYAKQGGLVIVQYQQYQFARGGYAPFPLDIHRPHDRVTDETAPIRVLVPDHPAFTTPNRLGPADWDGWVQERGLYFAGTWDDAYTPLLAMADPGRDEVQGGLLVAEVGSGHYVYTGLAFFRQLPAGVPGAYRLFMNLLALKTS